MEITIKRDGLLLKGDLMKPEHTDQCPAVIIFHGLMSDRGNPRPNMFSDIAQAVNEKGMAAIKFDFDGHGESDGLFRDMNVFTEILDAAKIVEYVHHLDWVSDIYIVGHSQGALVGGMIAGYYRDWITKLVMLSPAATIKDDALAGTCFGIPYDPYRIPDHISMTNVHNEHFDLGGLYFRLAKTLPIYETTAMFRGETLIIHGSADDVVDVSGARRYTQFMDHVTLNIIEGENHGLCEFSLKTVVRNVADFLAQQRIS